jgi:hypothetical protein
MEQGGGCRRSGCPDGTDRSPLPHTRRGLNRGHMHRTLSRGGRVSACRAVWSSRFADVVSRPVWAASPGACRSLDPADLRRGACARSTRTKSQRGDRSGILCIARKCERCSSCSSRSGIGQCCLTVIAKMPLRVPSSAAGVRKSLVQVEGPCEQRLRVARQRGASGEARTPTSFRTLGPQPSHAGLLRAARSSSFALIGTFEGASSTTPRTW